MKIYRENRIGSLTWFVQTLLITFNHMLHAVVVDGDELAADFVKGAGVDSEIQGDGFGVAADGGHMENVWIDVLAPWSGAGAFGFDTLPPFYLS